MLSERLLMTLLCSGSVSLVIQLVQLQLIFLL